ncbi:MAG: UDP-N-acetylmuramate dehydrogenase [Acidobacteriota bacterium]|nr:UDP-N-acetylmuramate dehydrogenase [Acidobacteriota bacterium]
MIEPAHYREIGEDLGVRAVPDLPLGPLTTMKVGGPASWVYFPESPEQACRLYAALERGPLPVRLLGAGSNVVVADEGIRAVVVATAGVRREAELLEEGRVLVPAGAGLPGLVRWTAAHGLSGLEFAEGIPAKLGGAICMNAGANGASIGNVVEQVLVGGSAGELRRHDVRAGDFGYRTSFVSARRLIVVGAVLRLFTANRDSVRETIREFKARRRDTQPLWERSAGCVFANWPEQPVGALVEQLGLKGLSVGDAEVSTLHGNFIINRGRATASDVLTLIERMRERLASEAGTTPRLEVQIWRDLA